ncbi:MAG: hypothetical protein ACI906_000233 [Candidatus Latescibacterota bacterium]|jgi:hypothetical protein
MNIAELSTTCFAKNAKTWDDQKKTPTSNANFIPLVIPLLERLKYGYKKESIKP